MKTIIALLRKCKRKNGKLTDNCQVLSFKEIRVIHKGE